MNLSEILNIKARKNPDSLLKLLVTTAIASIFIIILVSGFSFHQVYSNFVIKNAENISVQVCNALIEQQKELLFIYVPGKERELRQYGTEMFKFDSRLRKNLAPFSIIKVKVYNADKQIVYCTDPKLIGKTDKNNLRLTKALTGKVDAKMVTKELAHDLADEALLNVDVVETYVPIMSADKRILGSFEVYMNITPYNVQIRRGVVVMTVLLAVVLAGVFGFSYILIRGGTSQLKEVQSQLEIIAITDPLTGMHNRGFLMKRGEEELKRVQRSSGEQQKSLGCILLDLDHFKQVNDIKGHLTGDIVLKSVAQTLRSNVRNYDVIGRYGGEEFVILLPDTSFEQSLLAAEHIREKVRNELIEVAGERIPVTASLGVASSGGTDKSLTDIIRRADEGMYKAKAEGRDRVAWVHQPQDNQDST
ncbi:MAG: GGDEF domain-containing protein [Desulfuromonadales bacterium]